MPNQAYDQSASGEKDCYLPDFCYPETNLLMILVLELVAIVLSLASAPGLDKLFVTIALMSVYIQWTGLSSAAILCLLQKRRLLLLNTVSTTLISLLVVLLVTALMAIVAYQVNRLMQFELFRGHGAWQVMMQHVAIGLILFGLALRYFYVQHQGRKMIRMESHSRLQALQARIRPHFLFNSLNTIASLTFDQPERAERAIENLADLFRASLKADSRVSLRREIELTRDYINLEQLRLDERLQVDWQIDAHMEDALDTWELPALTLQPLVENAVYHGIEPLPEGGAIRIRIQQPDELKISISNPLSPHGPANHRQGNRMALANISERLQLAFQGRAKIEHVAENDLYKVSISIPADSS